jgi:hypothetical protein
MVIDGQSSVCNHVSPPGQKAEFLIGFAWRREISRWIASYVKGEFSLTKFVSPNYNLET